MWSEIWYKCELNGVEEDRSKRRKLVSPWLSPQESVGSMMLICPHRDDQEADSMSVSTARSKSIPDAESIVRGDPIPPLRDGDRLTHDEFMRWYEAMPDLKKAELIEGVVYVPSPVRSDQHGEPHATFGGWRFLYRSRTYGLTLADNATVHLDIGNTPQPDDVLFIKPDCGGQARVNEDGYILLLRSWSPRSPPARPATILTPSCRLTNAIVFASTSSGVSKTVRSIGSFCETVGSRTRSPR